MSIRRPTLAVVLIAVVCVSLTSSLTTARPPRPGTDENGLTENESATLWSHDDDSRYISNDEYREAYGENRSTIHQLANGTDLTFTQPPSTAARWTAADHDDYEPGGIGTSVYPSHASLEDGAFIRDAHATIFAVTPSTTVHRGSNQTVFYAAPNGTVRGLVDYRVAVPERTVIGNRTITYALVSHRVSEVRLVDDGEVIARTEGTHHPELPYRLTTSHASLRLEADIQLSLRRTTTIRNHTARGGNETQRNQTNHNQTRQTIRRTPLSETVTVSDTVEVQQYDLEASVRTVRYPDGDWGFTVFRNQPWQGITLSDDGEHRVRGVWRFYTARDTRWDMLTRATATDSTTIESPALPVFVHAYPSRLGPRAEPTGNGPELLRVWGVEREPATASIPSNVNVEVVDQPYTASYGLAVRTDIGDPETLTVRGIVRGVNGTIKRGSEPRQLRESELDVQVLSESDTGVRVLIELTDAETGEPIVLSPTSDPRYKPIVEGRSGYIEFAGQTVQTNSSGLATVTISDPGVYTARYVPGSWLSHDPAYTASTATTRWHPLGDVSGWIRLLTRLLVWFLPFALALYAGRRLGTIFRTRQRYQ